LHRHRGLVIGVGGEHGLTPALVRAAIDGRALDPARLTVVQFDAHADLRPQYEDSPHSHACAMRRVLDMGARVLAIGIRSCCRSEAEFARRAEGMTTFGAQALAEDPACEQRLLERLGALTGPVYLTVDVDALDPCLCPATGTPQPGGLGWWQTLGYLRRLLMENASVELVGADVVETVPLPGSQVGETTAARLVCKIIAYHAHRRARHPVDD
jgi:agmatinase